MLEKAFLIPIYPLFAFLVIIFFTRWKEKLSAYLSIAMILTGLIHSIFVLVEMIGRHGAPLELSIPFINLPSLQLEIGIWLDPLTAVMLMGVLHRQRQRASLLPGIHARRPTMESVLLIHVAVYFLYARSCCRQ